MSECTKIARFSAVAAAIFTTPAKSPFLGPKLRGFIDSKSFANFLCDKSRQIRFPLRNSRACGEIASEWRYAILVHSARTTSPMRKRLRTPSLWSSFPRLLPFRADREIVMQAVSNNGEALEHASQDLKASDILFPYRSPSPRSPHRPHPTPRNGPETDPDPNGPETDRNRAEMDRPKSSSLGWDGRGVCRDGGWGL